MAENRSGSKRARRYPDWPHKAWKRRFKPLCRSVRRVMYVHIRGSSSPTVFVAMSAGSSTFTSPAYFLGLHAVSMLHAVRFSPRPILRDRCAMSAFPEVSSSLIAHCRATCPRDIHIQVFFTLL